MQLVMGRSFDGYVAKDDNDDMKWLGQDDKIAFKLLTFGANQPLGVSAKTANSMPPMLQGRKLIRISRENYCLEAFYSHYPDGVLIGGQTLAIEAIKKRMIDRAHICVSDKKLCDIKGVNMAKAHPYKLQYYLTADFIRVGVVFMQGTEVEIWDRIK